MISPTASAISCAAPDSARCDVTPHDSTTPVPGRFHSSCRRAPRASGRRGIDPRSDRLWLWLLCRRVLHARHCKMRHRPVVLVVRSRQVGVAGVARTVRVCVGPGAIRWPGVQASSGIDCRREPPRSAIASQLATPTRCRIVFGLRHGRQAFPSLWWVRAEGKRGQNPRAFNHVGTRPTGPVG
jgi:hypothetical protein